MQNTAEEYMKTGAQLNYSQSRQADIVVNGAIFQMVSMRNVRIVTINNLAVETTPSYSVIDVSRTTCFEEL